MVRESPSEEVKGKLIPKYEEQPRKYLGTDGIASAKILRQEQALHI